MKLPVRRALTALAITLSIATEGSLLGAEDHAGAPEVRRVYVRSEWKAKFVRPLTIPFPPENEYTVDRELLGRTLFFDPRLSGSKWISCATCHNPGLAWTDGLPKGFGHGMKELGRRTPTILNAAWADSLFWDGRAESLEEQALGPIASPNEMNEPLDEMVEFVRSMKGYREMFKQAYPGEPIKAETVARAISTFERTVVSGTTSFDLWISGQESAIPEAAKRGFDLFNTRANCEKCHSGWNFTDNGFHDIGTKGSDKGRGVKLPLPSMQHAFKTPTLRNVEIRAPYLHNGSAATLSKVIDLYNEGGEEKRPSLAPEVFPLHLSESEKEDLSAFLRTLTSKDEPVRVPVLPSK